jgi:hypothetical protein
MKSTPAGVVGRRRHSAIEAGGKSADGYIGGHIHRNIDNPVLPLSEL